MADADTLDITVEEAIQRLAESIVRIERDLRGVRALAETLAVSVDLLQSEQLANRALMKQLLERYPRQDDKIGALTALVDHHHELLTKLANLPPRPAGDPLVN